MTVIAWDGKTLAADKQQTCVGLKSKTTKIKKTEHGELLFSSGKASIVTSLFHWYESGADADKYPKHQEDNDNHGWLYVIRKDKTIWCYERTAYPFPIEEERYADGSGRDYAMGAMAMGADAIEAVNIACHFDSECGLGIDSMTLDGSHEVNGLPVTPLKDKQ